MFLKKYILPLPFFIALFFGFLMVYVTAPEPRIVFKHPNPDNVDNNIYQEDEEGENCYKYEVDEVKCPVNKNIIKEHPVEYKGE